MESSLTPGGLVFSILVMFGTAKVLAEVAERVGQPGIVGEIIAGVLIGPGVLDWITPNETTTVLGELGIMFLLFRVGLEINATELMKVGATSAMVAIAGVILPFLVGWGISAYWGAPHLEAIFVGAAMTATSVGVTAQVLASKRLLSYRASQIILGAAVIDDILALLILGIVSSVAQGSVNVLELALTTLFALTFIVIVVRWGSWTVGKVFRRLEGRLKIGDAPFVLTMILMFGLAALSAEAGVAAITGAFLAGTALSEALPAQVHEQTLGISELFVPFFMAGIGLRLDVSVFEQRSTLILALVILVTAILSKVLACGLGAARFGFTVAKRVGLGMIPRGEFCIVAAQIGLAMKVIAVDMYAVVIFTAVITTMLAPPLVKFAFPSEAQQHIIAK